MSADDGTGTCGCCAGVTAATPVAIANRPGLSAIAWRVGTHARFKESLFARISALNGLRKLTSRDDDDPAVATMDAWAAVLDVLSFYQERIANEGFLRTATERRSLLELASAIGYEPRPGVAASVWLAFTLEDAPEAPRVVAIPAGTRALSLPKKDEPPQPFETAEELIARPEWNEIRLRMSQPQTVTATGPFYLQGTETGLAPGRPLLVVPPSSGPSTQPLLRRAATVEPDADAERTRVTLGPVPAPPPRRIAVGGFVSQPFLPGREPVSGAALAASFAGQTWRAADLRTLADARGWTLADLGTALTRTAHLAVAAISEQRGPAPGVYALRVTAAGFGYNAPPPPPTSTPPVTLPQSVPDDVHPIHKPSQDGSYKSLYGGSHEIILLDAVYEGILPGSWVVLTAPRQEAAFFEVVASDEVVRYDFNLTAKVTRLALEGATDSDLAQFPLRSTAVFALSEPLALSDEPILDDLARGETRIELAGLQLELAAGRSLLLTGEPQGLPGVVRSEVVAVAEVEHPTAVPAYTTLTLTRGLENAYRRGTVRLYANAVLATHGETVSGEILGSGDAARPFQRFALAEGPLTWTSAPVASGAESTLELRVDGVLWHEAPDLYRLAPRDRKYVLRQDDPGRTRVFFGDGVRGARLPTGSDNVTAVYRKGIGLAGLVDAGQVSLLDTRPLGVSEVVNPLPAAGAADRETRDEIRTNAPLTVLTLDRIVSLRDHDDFARSFSGIGKARAVWLVDHVPLVHVTVAAADGGAVPAGSELHRNLLAAMRRLRDPFQPLRVDTFDPLTFNLELKVKVDSDHRTDAVLQAVESALRQAFSFAARDFAQGVALSEVMTVAQQVAGVVAVDVDALYVGFVASRSLEPRLDARPAHQKPGGGIAPAQHLSLGAQGLTLGVMP